MGSSSLRVLFLLGFSSAFLACGGTAQVAQRDGSGAASGSAGVAGSGSGGTAGGTGGTGGTLPVGGKGGSGGDAGASPSDPCDDEVCGSGQRCELNDDEEAECVDNECDDLDCDDDEDCVEASGGGNICVPHQCDPEEEACPCDSDVNCPESRYCNADGECAEDECEADTRRCDGDEVLVCASNGGSEQAPYECSSLGPDYFQSECSDEASSSCTCEDDWDCPENTVCEVGVCTGTGEAPTCTLPPVAFEDVPPTLELQWGGERTANDAANANFDANSSVDDALGKAFPWSAQVLSTPMVVNLDDDNGDGKVNELDFPELVFMTYYEKTPGASNGVVRAIHGGGPNKGADYFALCGNPAPPATAAATYADANGAYWSEGEPTADRHGAVTPVACPDDTCEAGFACRNGACVPAPLTGCTSAAGENRGTALGRPAGALAIGDLDYDGFPEIVVPTEDSSGLQVLTNRGEVIFTQRGLFPDMGSTWDYAAPAIANLDFEGLAEIVVGNRVIVLRKNATSGALEFDHQVNGAASQGAQSFNGGATRVMGPSVCLGDVRADVPGMEIVAGTSLYQYDPAQNALVNLWNAAPAPAYADGFCAVADVWGADMGPASAAPGPDNELDGVPEVIVISNGTLLILNSQTGAVIRSLALAGGNDGGAPNVDDFDGDGYPEIATALANFYTVIDLQAEEATNCPLWPDLLPQEGAAPGTNPARTPGGSCNDDADCNEGAVCNETAGRCVCLQNGWRRDTEDDSSRATASSIFDFNGDGAAEVVYNDECYFRVYDGASGNIYLATPSLSRTIIENPVVADVDNDGNAEIVLVNNNEELQCSETMLDSVPAGAVFPRNELPNGISVYGDSTDTWVAARRVWNQHSYHVTNVLESGGLPLHEPESWKPLHGRLYNSFRSQPRVYGVAPNLALSAIQVSSPGAACGELEDEIQITVLVRNDGDLRVGPGVEIAFYGTWDGDEEALVDDNREEIVVTLDKSLEPGASTLVTVTYQAGNNADHDDLPESVRAEIDGDDAERECDEDDNEISGDVDAGDELADLSIEVTAGDCFGEVEVTITNDGSLDAEDIVIRIYAGDPSSGGRLIGETTLDGPLEPGDSEDVTVTVEVIDGAVTLWGVADPRDTIPECNDANNLDKGPTLDCGVVR